MAWSLGNLSFSKGTRRLSDECPWSRRLREQVLGSHAGRQELRTSWSLQLVLKQQSESSDQIRKVYRIFLLCDGAGVWAECERWPRASFLGGNSSRTHHRAPQHSGRCKARARDLGIAAMIWLACGPFVRLSTLDKIKLKPRRERPQLQVCWTHVVVLAGEMDFTTVY